MPMNYAIGNVACNPHLISRFMGVTIRKNDLIGIFIRVEGVAANPSPI